MADELANFSASAGASIPQLMLFGAVTQKEHLQVKRPLPHIGIEIRQVGIIGNTLISSAPAHPFPQPFGQGGFSCPNIASYKNQSFHGFGEFVPVDKMC